MNSADQKHGWLKWYFVQIFRNITVGLLCIILFVFCFVGVTDAKPIKIVATLGQITDIVQIIGQKKVTVKGLMGAGVDPHLYRATESDVRHLSSAEIIFFNGLNLEAKLGKILKQMDRHKKVVALGESIDKTVLLDSVTYANHPDPHIWFNVQHWSKVTQMICDTLIEYDPQNSELYSSRTKEYLKKLHNLDSYVTVKSQELSREQRVLVTAHDAFRYFGQRYDFEVVGLQGISTESRAGVKSVSELANFIVKREIKAIFVESSVSERSIRAVQEAVKSRGWTVVIGGELFSDAMGDEGTEEGSYIGMINHNINTIVEALKGNEY